MIAFFSNLFGYVLNFIYNFVGNYGIAIIIFSILIKLLLLPISIKQQKTLKKTTKLQEKLKTIQFKYKNDPERLNKETMELYKTENMSPFSGCFSAIIQLILLFSVFYLVRSPLTYMRKIDDTVIDKYYNIMAENEMTSNKNYPQIDIIREIDNIKKIENVEINEEEIDAMSINMEFLGIDLSQIPTQSNSGWKAYIIPVLYVVVSFISMKITTTTPKTKKKEDTGTESDKKEEEFDPMAQMNKNMTMMMPIMYIFVALVAPLGLALYWLVNSLLIIVERLILNKVLKDEEE